MAEATQKHVFEPFFTTKEIGKGTGPGTGDSVRNCSPKRWTHRGSESVMGQGTTFWVYLPQATRSATGRTRLSLLPRPPNGTETILLVEDETAVRRLAVTSLAILWL